MDVYFPYAKKRGFRLQPQALAQLHSRPQELQSPQVEEVGDVGLNDNGPTLEDVSGMGKKIRGLEEIE